MDALLSTTQGFLLFYDYGSSLVGLREPKQSQSLKQDQLYAKKSTLIGNCLNNPIFPYFCTIQIDSQIYQFTISSKVFINTQSSLEAQPPRGRNYSQIMRNQQLKKHFQFSCIKYARVPFMIFSVILFTFFPNFTIRAKYCLMFKIKEGYDVPDRKSMLVISATTGMKCRTVG